MCCAPRARGQNLIDFRRDLLHEMGGAWKCPDPIYFMHTCGRVSIYCAYYVFIQLFMYVLID